MLIHSAHAYMYTVCMCMQYGYTALMLAASGNFTRVVKELVLAKADISKRSKVPKLYIHIYYSFSGSC